MWIVQLALRRPYTFAVLALLILILGVASILTMATDVFPAINIPVVTVIWSYGGITPNDMEKRFVTQSERAYTTSVNDIEHIESQSVSGIGVIKIYLQPNADIGQGIAQVAATSQVILRALPPGTTPPYIIRFDASDVPVVQAVVGSPSMSEQQLFDYGQNFIRTQLATVQGAQIPLPYGGRSRLINVDVDPQALYAKGLSPYDLSNAISAQNLILPSGDAKIGSRDYTVTVNSSPAIVQQLNDLPIRQVNGTTVYVRDVASVRDGYAVQTNIVDLNGRRAALLTINKSGSASTLDVVNRVRQALPRILSTVPKELNVSLIADQSVFVREAVQSVVREATIAACLTALMILLFLGSLRSTAIVAVSIPLSILASIAVLNALGQTLNTSTLGGLALAVGILVDDTTVTIENINRYIALGRPLRQAILEGSAEIALPALVSTLSICIVFLPMAFLSGVSRYLFLPLAEAVIFAMLASYILSRTVTPTFAMYLLPKEVPLFREEGYGHADEEGPKDGHRRDGHGPGKHGHMGPRHAGNGKNGHRREQGEDAARLERQRNGFLWRTHHRFNEWFEHRRDGYRDALTWVMDHRLGVSIVFVAFCALSFCLYPFVGRDFFPQVDAGQIRLHVRVPPATRLEETARIFSTIEQQVRQTIPPAEIGQIMDNIGEPISVNLAYGDSATVGPADGEILISLKPGHHPTEGYVETLRRTLPRSFPEDTFFFQPADIVNQILNFGLPAPIDVQVSGPNRNQKQDLDIAHQIVQKIAAIPGAADVHLQQITDAPGLRVNVDRTRAEQVGLTQSAVAQSLLVSLAGTGQAAPDFFLNNQNGVVYSVTVQTPQYRLDSPDALLSTPLTAPGLAGPQLLSNVATIEHDTNSLVITHYNIQPTYDIYASTQNRDLGGVAGDINRVLAGFKKHLPRGSTVTVRGQVQSMTQSFTGLGLGLIGAVVLVYLLMAVNFQSWLDPLVVVSGAPGALAGILWMLFVTQTTINVPSLTGAIMTIGVSTANSVLLVTFANERRLEGMSARDAAISAGYTRLRPVLMTALAMILGMLPMALAIGAGSEQDAPLGRAVIGGLLVATLTTLFIVPISYSVLRRADPEPLPGEEGDAEKPQPAKRRHPVAEEAEQPA
ncbi:MAG: efflux RND transporter permease subunit [Armatimonadetes bacterium]|nr:efflux RND transporter permease subunit [Armatimonadota bacterium]